MQTRIVFIGKTRVTLERFGGGAQVTVPLEQFSRPPVMGGVVDIVWSVDANGWVVELQW